jgi:hypothetical protein
MQQNLEAVPAPFTASAPSPKVAFDYLLNFVEI